MMFVVLASVCFGDPTPDYCMAATSSGVSVVTCHGRTYIYVYIYTYLYVCKIYIATDQMQTCILQSCMMCSIWIMSVIWMIRIPCILCIHSKWLLWGHKLPSLSCVTSFPWKALQRNALHFFALRLIALHCIALHFTALHCIALHCMALSCVAWYRVELPCVALHCNALPCVALLPL